MGILVMRDYFSWNVNLANYSPWGFCVTREEIEFLILGRKFSELLQ